MTNAAWNQGTRQPKQGGMMTAMEDKQSNPRAIENCGMEMIMVRFWEYFTSPMHGQETTT